MPNFPLVLKFSKSVSEIKSYSTKPRKFLRQNWSINTAKKSFSKVFSKNSFKTIFHLWIVFLTQLISHRAPSRLGKVFASLYHRVPRLTELFSSCNREILLSAVDHRLISQQPVCFLQTKILNATNLRYFLVFFIGAMPLVFPVFGRRRRPSFVQVFEWLWSFVSIFPTGI